MTKRKSSAIFVSAIALGLRRLCLSKHPPKALVSTSVPVTQATHIRLIPATMGAILLTVTPIQAMAMTIQAMAMPIQAMAMAVLITALIGAMADALVAELIGDGIAGIKRRGYRSRQKCCQLRHVDSDAPTSRP